MKTNLIKAKYKPRVLTKEEQLRLVFSHLLAGILTEYDLLKYGGTTEAELKSKYTNIFLREVTIRVKL